jgi:hypothetical protein
LPHAEFSPKTAGSVILKYLLSSFLISRVMLEIRPPVVDFACVPVGFIYRLEARVVNVSSKSQRIKIMCVQCGEDDNNMNKVIVRCNTQQFAAGSSLPFTIELHAVAPQSNLQYRLNITGEHGTETKLYVFGIVLPSAIYKYFAKSLRLQNRDILKRGVQVISLLRDQTSASESRRTISYAGDENRAAIRESPSLIESNFISLIMDDDDLDEILSCPLLYNMYLDPKRRCVAVDEELSAVGNLSNSIRIIMLCDRWLSVHCTYRSPHLFIFELPHRLPSIGP